MEDEDDTVKSVDAFLSTVEEPTSEGEPQVSEQCDTVLTAEDVIESRLPERNVSEGENVEDLKLEDTEMQELDEYGVKLEDLEVKKEKVVDEGDKEVDKVKELNGEGAKVEVDGTKVFVDDDGVKLVELEMGNKTGIEELQSEDSKEDIVGERREELVGEGVKLEDFDRNTVVVVEGEVEIVEDMVKAEDDKESKMEEERGGSEDDLKEEEMVGEGGGEEAPKEEEAVGEEGDEEENEEGLDGEEGCEEAVNDEELVGEGGEEAAKEELVGSEGGEEMEDLEANVDEEVPQAVAEEEEETPVAETEMETESEVVKSNSGSGGKRRRGKNAKATTSVKAPARKIVGEDVCFICLDGGDLVLCDRRGCPKAYHPSCVDHDDEFFKTKGRWNCGWHLCNQCRKTAYFLCYTCTFSLCKACSKDAVIFPLRGSKGLCESCMKTVTMIENSEQNTMGHSSFDDNSSWEYLFKDYWIEQKGKLCITSDEIAQAKNSRRDSDVTNRQQTPIELHEGYNDAGTDSDSSLAKIEAANSKTKRKKRKSKNVDSGTDSSSEKEAGITRKKKKKRLKSQAKEDSDSENSSGNQATPAKRGKSSRRLNKSRSKDSANAADGELYMEGNVEWATKELLEFVMHMKNGDGSVLSQFDVQGLLLEYIKRNKLRDPRRRSQILCDTMLQKLFGKPRVGHFEMLKLLESHFLLKEDSHAYDNRGSFVDTETSQLDIDDHTDSFLDSGKSRGKKSRKKGEERAQSNLDDYAAIDMHNIDLIYLRRCLMESLMDDSETFHEKVVGSFVRIRISGSSQKQDIYRLVQIVGTSKAPEPYKVGKRTTEVMLEILNLDKTEIIAIDTISNQEFTEDECKRLRQSIKCGLINRMTVGDVLEKARELQEVRVTDWLEAEILRLTHLRDRASEKGRKKELRECVEKLQLLNKPEERQRRLNEFPEVHADPKMDPSCESDDENEMHDKRQGNMRPRDGGFFRRGREHFSSPKGSSASNDSWCGNARPPNKTWEPSRNLPSRSYSSRREDTTSASQFSEHSWSNGVDKGTPKSNNWDKPRITQDTLMTRSEQSGTRSDLSVTPTSESSQPLSTAGQTDVKANETEKSWRYRDPTDKVQGPFSMAQLRKWSNTGYFPAELKIWKASQTEDDSILLTEALAGRFQKELRPVGTNLDVGSKIRNAPSSMDTSKLSGGRYGSSNLPSPTPSRSPSAWSGKPTSSSFKSTGQFQGNERLPSPTPTSPSSDPSGVGRATFSKGNVVGNKQETATASLGAVQPAPVPAQFVSNSGMINVQQMSSQSGIQLANQPFVPPDTAMNPTNIGPHASAAQGFSNMVQSGTGQNTVYTQNWGPGFVARPEVVNTNFTANTALPSQAAYHQWTGAPVGNQAPLHTAAGYPPGQGNIAATFPTMPANNAWRPSVQTNMPWGAQQQPVNQNVGWTGPAAAMGQLSSPTPGAPAMAVRPGTVGWTGTGPSPTGGNTNMVWVAAPGNTGTWGGDQNPNVGGAQWNRQPSFGSGGRVCSFHENGHCRKGSACDFKHN
ncbi:unnamed protein product [Amaranthus hypochondriacus]